MKVFLSIALGAASIVSTAVLAPTTMMAQAAQTTQPGPVTAIAVSLETKLDTKTAKVGDVFSTRLMQDGTVGGMKFPTGSHLLGKVKEVKPGTLVLLFDSIQVKKADPVPVHAGLAAIAEAFDAFSAGSGGGASEPAGGGSGAAGRPGPLDFTALGSTIKGVTLTMGKTADVSGTLESPKDFKLDKSTRMWVGLF
jgi:hypothetical protein